jgi:hypothetical protein
MTAVHHGVYLFRHVQTNQVLVSLKQNMKVFEKEKEKLVIN